MVSLGAAGLVESSPGRGRRPRHWCSNFFLASLVKYLAKAHFAEQENSGEGECRAQSLLTVTHTRLARSPDGKHAAVLKFNLLSPSLLPSSCLAAHLCSVQLTVVGYNLPCTKWAQYRLCPFLQPTNLFTSQLFHLRKSNSMSINGSHR